MVVETQNSKLNNPSWLKRFINRIKALLNHFALPARYQKESLSQHSSTLNTPQPKMGVQWQLDASYSEGPQYHNTVVYVDRNALDDNAKEYKQSEDMNKRITHYPPTHRLH